MKQQEHIQTLIDKYLDGLTSETEEQELHRWFAAAGDNLPESWQPYKSLFAYIDAQREALLSHTPPAAAPQPARRRRIRLRRLVTAAAAAAVALIITVTTLHRRQPDSYAVIDGKVYTDSRTVNEQALEALQIVSSDYDDSFSALDMMK